MATNKKKGKDKEMADDSGKINGQLSWFVSLFLFLFSAFLFLFKLLYVIWL